MAVIAIDGDERGPADKDVDICRACGRLGSCNLDEQRTTVQVVVDSRAEENLKSQDNEGDSIKKLDEEGDRERREGLLQTYRDHYKQAFEGVPEISSEELLERLNNSATSGLSSFVLVDCRSDPEHSVSMIPGALTIAEVEENLEKYKDKELVAYCAIGRRSGLFTKRMLEEHPSIKIRNHIGGLLDWTHVDGPLVNRTKQTATNRIFFTGGGHLKHLPNRGNLDILLPEDLPAAAT